MKLSAILVALTLGAVPAAAHAQQDPAPGAEASSSARAARPARGDAPLAARELAELGGRDAFSAVQALRPAWLRRQPQTLSGRDAVVVYFGDMRMGGVEALREMSTSDIGEIRYLRPAAAQLRFGSGHLNGAIVVTPAR
jgi:hypothetical protein